MLGTACFYVAPLQLYDSGACVYFYFGFIAQNLDDPVPTHATPRMPRVACAACSRADARWRYAHWNARLRSRRCQVGKFSAVEHDAREEIMKFGGSLSHHHGVGKIRKVRPCTAQRTTHHLQRAP
jgi:hypothetical protein